MVLTQGFAVEEFIDKVLARTTVKVIKEKVIKVFHGTNGSLTKVSTPSRRITRAAAAAERYRPAAIREAQIEEDNGIRNKLIRDEHEEELSAVLQLVMEEHKVEEVNTEMEIELPTSPPNITIPPPPSPAKEGQGLEDSQHADKKLSKEQLEALYPKLDMDSETDSKDKQNRKSINSYSIASHSSDRVIIGLGLVEWAKVADLIEKGFKIIHTSRPAFWNEGNNMYVSTKRKMVNLAVAFGHLVQD